LISLQARGGIDVHAQDLLRLVRGDFFDVHAAGRRGDDGHAAALAVQRERQVDLALDLRPDSTYTVSMGRPSGPVCLVTSRWPSMSAVAARTASEIARELDAAGLAAPAGMHLGLDHPQCAA
jgi:hypothetical protein